MNELSSHNTGAGKGDGDRSPKWRDHYDEIDWRVSGKARFFSDASEGFERVSAGRLRKRYGAGAPAGVSVENMDTGEIKTYESKTPSEHIARRTNQPLFEPPAWALATDSASVTGESELPPMPPQSKTCCGGRCGKGDN
jgi:hypothetical protein